LIIAGAPKHHRTPAETDFNGSVVTVSSVYRLLVQFGSLHLRKTCPMLPFFWFFF